MTETFGPVFFLCAATIPVGILGTEEGVSAFAALAVNRIAAIGFTVTLIPAGN